jgi:ribosomal protein S18 acetylase RimI-like enzyme
MTVVVRQTPPGWTAWRDGAVVGRLSVLVRPDQRCFLVSHDCDADAYGPLLDAALAARDQDVYVELDEVVTDAQRACARRGFTVNRREHHYLLPTDPARTGLIRRGAPNGLGIISAAQADADRLRKLDDALRQEVPGTAGWRNAPQAFLRQTFEHPQFDPATYLVAIHHGTGRYVGLVRVWITPGQARLGLIGVLPRWRRRGLAVALLAQAFGVLHDRGLLEATCEVDQTNTASNALMTSIGARRTGGHVELVRRRRLSGARAPGAGRSRPGRWP